MAYSNEMVDAFAFAFALHRTQTRKGSGVPYVTHLMAVAAIVGEYGGTERQVIAALLHDAVEDQGGAATLERVRLRFGPEVADFVAACSDADTIPKPPWRPRKEAFLKRVADAPAEVKLIVAADKLDNARSLAAALREVGPPLWERFNGGRDGTLWYFGEMVRVLASGWEHPILSELADAVDRLHRMAQ